MYFKTIEWRNDKVIMIDQRLLPMKELYNEYSSYIEVADAIRDMVIRGAPAIGVAAAMGIALGSIKINADDINLFTGEFDHICALIGKTRPTAVNLFWAINRMKKVFDKNKNSGSIIKIKGLLKQEALNICEEDMEINKRLGNNGAELLKNGDTVLTHCNAGALATAGYGTALGVIRSAIESGKSLNIFADETRPFLQGSRLTAWELMKENIDVTVITDNMSGFLMKKGEIDAVIVGADRIAANGDVANKIGTYMVAVLANRHSIPFYVAAPVSTIDLNIQTGRDIPIEERDSKEVTHYNGLQVVPDGVKVRNPAFDVTPNDLVTAIITEAGVVKGNFPEELKKLFY